MSEESSTLQLYSMLIRRAELASAMGVQFGGKRNLFDTLGYKGEITYKDFLAKYLRQDIANAIIKRPINVTWQGDVRLVQGSDDKETRLEKAYAELYNRFRLKHVFTRADTVTCIGRYGVMLLGLDDVDDIEGYGQPVTGTRKLNYIKPLSEENAQVKTWNQDVSSERFALPELYEVTLSGKDNSKVIEVHHSRVIHMVRERFESEVYGVPILTAVYNRLDDLEKLVGASAEMFWKGARPGYQGKIDTGYAFKKDDEKTLQEQIEELEHDLRRFIVSEGLDLKSLETQVASPESHVRVQIEMISAATGIPKRILSGSERGEMSSAQDATEWNKYVQGRRDEYAETEIIRPFIDRCMEYGILPKSEEEYSVEWEDLHTVSDKDKASVGQTRASALSSYTQNTLAQEVVPPNAFMEFFLGLEPHQIELINEMSEEALRWEEEEKPVEEDEDVERT